MTGALRASELRGVPQLAAAVPGWTDLLRRDPLAAPFQHPGWLLPYCHAFGVSEPWAVAAWRGERLAALALLVT